MSVAGPVSASCPPAMRAYRWTQVSLKLQVSPIRTDRSRIAWPLEATWNCPLHVLNETRDPGSRSLSAIGPNDRSWPRRNRSLKAFVLSPVDHRVLAESFSRNDLI